MIRPDNGFASDAATRETPNFSPSAGDDPRVTRALEEYLADCEVGARPDRGEFLARYPEIAAALEGCLDGLDFIHAASPALSRPDGDGLPAEDLPLTGPLGDFRILREVGRGGMGIVYEAEQISLARRVALKVLPFAATLDPRHLRRFQNEARTAAGLHHTNIVPVFFVGCERGVHYYAMQFIDGHDLASVLAQNHATAGAPEFAPRPTEPGNAPAGQAAPPAALPGAPTPPIAGLSTERAPRSLEHFRTLARLGIQAAEALDHAHQQGIIHRDIKPANLLVDADGRLWVTDFGLAHIQSDSRLTTTGDLVGTLRYMSPEQALAKRVVVDQRTDIYSLGATLYELLALRPVFGGSDRQELLRQIAFEEPKPLRRINKTIPAELEVIVHKALEKNPDDRYSTAQELADDLQHFLRDESIRARRPGLRQRFGRWCRRHKAVVWSAAVILIVLLPMLAGTIGWVARDQETRRAETARVVEAALREEEFLRRQRKYPEALSAARRAVGMLAAGLADEELRRHAETRLVNEEMIAHLEEVRLQIASQWKGEFLDFAAADREYARVFRDYGIDVEKLPLEQAAEQIKATGICVELAAAVDDWASMRRRADKRADTWKHLCTVARTADCDKVRQKLRGTIETQDQTSLKQLASSLPIAELPVPTLVLFARTLKDAGLVSQAAAVLRTGQQQHPEDFWVNFELAQIHILGVRPLQPDQAVRFNSAALAVRPDNVVVLTSLANMLWLKGEFKEAEGACRKAIEVKPDRPLSYLCLGIALRSQHRLSEAIAAYRKAIALKPDYGLAYVDLGDALYEQRNLSEAVAAYRKAIELQCPQAQIYNKLGCALRAQEKLPEAIIAYRKAIELKPVDLEPGKAVYYNNLGEAFCAMQKLPEAIAACREAIALRPDYAEAYYNLGLAFQTQGKSEEAVQAYRKAIALKPAFAPSYGNLGNVLRDRGQLPDAISAYRKALELRPDNAIACNNLGIALRRQGKLQEAATFYQKAIKLKPDFAYAYSNLGYVLRDQGNAAEAVAAYRKAISIDGNFAEAHCHLGLALQDQGLFASALAVLKEGHELGTRRAKWTLSSARWVRDAQKLVELDALLPGVLSGKTHPANAAQCLDLAKLCQLPCRQQYAAATRLFAECFTAVHHLAKDLDAGNRYDAACAAALAGCAQGKDAATLDAKEYVRLRDAALAWLRADLAAWRSELENSPNKVGQRVAETMEHWQTDADFHGVRGPSLAKLPEAEHSAWQRLWLEVEDLRKQAVQKR